MMNIFGWVVVATLGVAVLFVPLLMILELIDRRTFRRKIRGWYEPAPLTPNEARRRLVADWGYVPRSVEEWTSTMIEIRPSRAGLAVRYLFPGRRSRGETVEWRELDKLPLLLLASREE